MSPIAVSDRRTHSIACIPADGIGPEVISAGVEVLKTLASVDGTFDMTFEDYDWSSETYKKTGKYIPDGGLDGLKKHDAILFGAVGAPGTPLSPLKTYLALMRLQTFQTTSPFGVSAWQSAKPSSNTPMSVQPKYSAAHNHHYEMPATATSTGSSSARIVRASTLVKEGDLIGECRGR